MQTTSTNIETLANAIVTVTCMAVVALVALNGFKTLSFGNFSMNN